jgi:hypothetical protein
VHEADCCQHVPDIHSVPTSQEIFQVPVQSEFHRDIAKKERKNQAHRAPSRLFYPFTSPLSSHTVARGAGRRPGRQEGPAAQRRRSCIFDHPDRNTAVFLINLALYKNPRPSLLDPPLWSIKLSLFQSSFLTGPTSSQSPYLLANSFCPTVLLIILSLSPAELGTDQTINRRSDT